MANHTSLTSLIDADFHRDVDQSSSLHMRRLIALFLSGWKIQRGRGPRNNDICLWCRGEMTDYCESIVHKCQNAWPLNCFFLFLDAELMPSSGPPPSVVTCPMCREKQYHLRGYDRLLTSADLDLPVLVIPTRFTPKFVLRSAVEDKRRVLLMESSQLRLLRLFKHDRRVIHFVSSLKRDQHDRIITDWQEASPGDGNEEKSRQQLPSKLFPTWVLIDLGDNIFRACTFMLPQMNDLRSELSSVGVDAQYVLSETLVAEARERGGLKTIFDAIQTNDFNAGLEEMEKTGDEFLLGSPGSRVPWAENAYFHLLRFLAGGRDAQKIEDSRFQAFLTRFNLAHRYDLSFSITNAIPPPPQSSATWQIPPVAQSPQTADSGTPQAQAVVQMWVPGAWPGNSPAPGGQAMSNPHDLEGHQSPLSSSIVSSANSAPVVTPADNGPALVSPDNVVVETSSTANSSESLPTDVPADGHESEENEIF